MPGAGHIGLVLPTFLASAVEFVEALMILLAMGVTRSWRSALWATAAAPRSRSRTRLVRGRRLLQGHGVVVLVAAGLTAPGTVLAGVRAGKGRSASP